MACWFVLLLFAMACTTASRIAEQLDLCGVRRESLSSRARLNLHLIASVASALHLAQTGPHLVLAAWAALALQQSKATALKVRSSRHRRVTGS